MELRCIPHGVANHSDAGAGRAHSLQHINRKQTETKEELLSSLSKAKDKTINNIRIKTKCLTITNMRASGFMVPAEKVVTATPNDSVRKVMDLMLSHKVGAVVVVNIVQKNDTEPSEELSTIPIALGIITKSDILQAYRERVDIDDPCRKIMGDRKLVSCLAVDDRGECLFCFDDQVARILEKHKTHHVIVVDEKYARFVGIVSSWDIAAECSKDNRAWPYLRGEDGKIQFPEKVEKDDVPVPPPYDPEKPTSILNHKHDEFTTYMDDLDLEAFQ
ncbi:hypothetical protein ACHAXR_013311 [Thalassiosira sp. AJA248-18]